MSACRVVALVVACLLLLTGLLAGEEEAPQIHPSAARIQEAYQRLPENINWEGLRELYSYMLSVAVVSEQTLDAGFLIGRFIPWSDHFGEAYGFSEDFIRYVHGLHVELRFHKNADGTQGKPISMKQGKEPTRKYLYFRIALAKLAMEAKAREGHEVPFEKRALLAISLLMQVGDSFQYLSDASLRAVKECQALFTKEVSAFEEEYGVFEWFRKEVEGRCAGLEVEGNDIYERLAQWKAMIGALSNDAITHYALLSWFFLNISDDVLLKSHEFSPPVKAQSKPARIVRHFGRPEVFDSIIFGPDEWVPVVEEGRSRHPETLLMARLFTCVQDKFLESTSIPGKSSVFRAATAPLLETSLIYLLSTDALAVSVPVCSRLREYYSRPNMERNSWLSDYLRPVEEGESGSAWFAGGFSNFDSGTHELGDDALYPFVFITSRGGRSHLQCILDRLEHFEWRMYYHEEDMERDPLRSYCVNAKVDTSLYPGRISEILAGGWRARVLEGTGSAYSGSDDAAIARDFVPCVFYKFARTKWRLFNLAKYNADFDFYYYDSACTVVDVLPLEGEQPVEVKLGILHKDLCSWIGKSAGYAKGKYAWHLLDFARNQENGAPFMAAAERMTQLFEMSKSGAARHEDGVRLLELMEQ